MKIQLISPALPPALDGIGDYTALLARELSAMHTVKILYPEPGEADVIPRVSAVAAFSVDRRRSVLRLADVIAADPPDWVMLQFNQFSYGKWGLNPFLPFLLQAVLHRCPRTRIAVMFHEDFVPPINWKFRVMRIWQRWQFRAIGQAADVVFFSIEAWARRYSKWFGPKSVIHLPVGSNIPEMPIGRDASRLQLAIRSDQLVFGLFGSGHTGEMLRRVRAVLYAAQRAGHKAMLLYIGTNGSTVRDVLAGMNVRDEGPLPAASVSQRLHAIDIHLTPFVDGVSTRRGSMLAGLQHGLATVGTIGLHTDDVLRRSNGDAMLLAPVESEELFASQAMRLAGDAELRVRVGQSARELYMREFTWPAIAKRMMDTLNANAMVNRPPALHRDALEFAGT